jgi:hypothetical protein
MKHLSLLFLVATLTGCDAPPAVDQAPVAVAEQAAPVHEQGAVTKQTERKIPWGRVVLYGLFNARSTGSMMDNANSSTGKVIRGSVLNFTEQTQRIPLLKGTRFGYRYKLKLPSDESRPEIRRVLMHPEMTLLDGSTVSRSERTLRKRATYGIVNAIDAYALSEDYELVEGDWTFQLWYEDKLVVEQTFTTYRPDKDELATQESGPS